jgi:small GTP-binding protein
MERTLSVLDYAILVISGSEGVQAHTETLWRLLERYNVPAFIFVNKMDLSERSKTEVMDELSKKLGTSCVDFSCEDDEFYENIAMCHESLMDSFLKNRNRQRITP